MIRRRQGKRVAIKKIFPMSRDVVSAKHALREIRLMRCDDAQSGVDLNCFYR